MKFEVNRLAMLEAAKSMAKIVPTNAPVNELNNILIEANDSTGEVFLTATSYEVSIQQKINAYVEESGSMLVTPRMLIGMMSLLLEQAVKLSADSAERLTVTGGRCRYQINCIPSKSYPKPTMPFPEESVIMTGICSLAKRTAFLVSKDESIPALQCVKINLRNNAVHATASDGVGIMLTKDSAEQSEEREFLLPGRSFAMLASISKDSDVFEVGDIGREIVFVRGDMIFTIRKLATGTYMDTAALVKSITPAYSAVTDVSKMREALDIISISALMGNSPQPINLVLSDNEIALSCTSDYSEGNTSVPAVVSQKTAETGFLYNASALQRLFNVLDGRVKLELDTNGFMLVKTRSEVYIQSPLRSQSRVVRSAEKSKEKQRAKGAEEMKRAA
ncbi:MAG: hypothetical protein FWG87_01545 [Defluviitaleaceae bacterium]|nr:hypothetical protein [Defluviitaleaceae bacterium]